MLCCDKCREEHRQPMKREMTVMEKGLFQGRGSDGPAAPICVHALHVMVNHISRFHSQRPSTWGIALGLLFTFFSCLNRYYFLYHCLKMFTSVDPSRPSNNCTSTIKPSLISFSGNKLPLLRTSLGFISTSFLMLTTLDVHI